MDREARSELLHMMGLVAATVLTPAAFNRVLQIFLQFLG